MISILMLISGILIIWLIAALIQTVHNRQNGVYIYKHREYKKIDGKLMIVKVRDEKVNFGLAFVAYLINDFKQTIKQSDGSADNPVQEITFFILIFLLYFLVLTYVQVTAQDIATEKGTKMMEVIFSSMPGGDYFIGKILGIFGEIITQVLIYALGLAGCYYAAPYIGGVSDSFNKFKPMIDQVVGNLLSWNLLFTVLALVLFIIFAAFCGALTAKSENANKAVSPLTTVGIVGFLIAINLQSAGDPIWAKILSYVPFLSSFIMPMRVLKGNATGFEAGISAVAALLAIVISFMWIRRIYPKLILQTDDLGPWQNFKRGLLNQNIYLASKK